MAMGHLHTRVSVVGMWQVDLKDAVRVEVVTQACRMRESRTI